MPLPTSILEQAIRDRCTGNDCGRLVHGRGGNFPGLEHVSIDWFPPTLLVTLHADDPGNAELGDFLGQFAAEQPSIETVVTQHRFLPGSPKQVSYGALPDHPVAVESGLRFQLALNRNHNHGFFLDMKPGRDWIRSTSKGKTVLNLFAYTCSLSVAAIAGGATSVVNLDMASSALNTGRRNHQLNFDQPACKRASYLPHDLFNTWGKLKRLCPFDIIIIDPPSHQKGSFVVDKDYPRIARRLAKLIHPQTRILACVNSPRHDEDYLKDVFRDFPFEQTLPTAPGFEDQHPEAALKMLIFSSPG